MSNSAYPTDVPITITLAALAADAWWQSLVFSNISPGNINLGVGGLITTGTTPVLGGTIDIWAYGQTDDAPFYTAGASGADEVYTPDGQEGLLKFVESIVVNATSDQGYEFGLEAIATAFKGMLPPAFGIIVHNSTSVALNATPANHRLTAKGITYA